MPNPATDIEVGFSTEADVQPRRYFPSDSKSSREEFLSRMSHELRTPLNAVIGFARVLESNRAGNQRPEDLKLLARVRANGEQLLRLIEDVLDQSTIQRGELMVSLSETNVVEVVGRVVEHYRPQAAAKGLRLFALLPESATPLTLDPRRLQQVAGHLLDNAVKFTPSGTIKVTLATDKTGRPTSLIVADSGIGIPSERVQDVFLPFEQVDGTSRRAHDGAGLGLSLALELSEAMGCQLSVDSQVGEGSRFTIRFPKTSAV
jgi:signal transduction histidine kinase